MLEKTNNNSENIVIIDYGMGNLRSVENKFRHLEQTVTISSDPVEIEKANKLVLPGVGHFKKGMDNIHEMGLFEILNKKVLTDKTPILGICLGMQLFTNYSEEGDAEGFGWINAETLKFDLAATPNKLKVPHMGWNNIIFNKPSALTEDLPADNEFYFVHSYYVKCNNEADVLTTTDYGVNFVSSVENENIYGTQFHPEKSHDIGLKMMENFMGV